MDYINYNFISLICLGLATLWHLVVALNTQTCKTEQKVNLRRKKLESDGLMIDSETKSTDVIFQDAP